MRKTLFWIHLTAGLTAGVVILTMSITGVLLMYERQVIEFADRQFRSTIDGHRLRAENLLQMVDTQVGARPDSLTLHAEADAAAEVTVGTRVVYADAYSGKVLGEGSRQVRRFFRVVTDWHRCLAFEGPQRATARSITGAANLLLMGLALSGLFLWLPRNWTWSKLRPVLWFRGGLSPKARDFNWHNVIGFWCALPLLVITAGAAVISFPWATNLVYRLTGTEPPPPAARPQNGHRDETKPKSLAWSGLDRAWKQAETTVPGWNTITWRYSPSDRITLAISESHRGRVDLRSTLTVDGNSGEVVSHEKFSDYNRGRQSRMWLRFLHTGESLGVAGQTIAGIASAGGAVLVWTGLSLALRRFRSWLESRSRRPANAQVQSEVSS